jgi:hypothetical protein
VHAHINTGVAVIFTDDVDVADVDKPSDQYRWLLVHQLRANSDRELSARDIYVDSFYSLLLNADERYKCLQSGTEGVDHFHRFAPP